MKATKRKIAVSIVMSLIMCMMFSVTAFAATSTSSKTYAKMNALNGLSVTKYATISATGSNPSITKVELSLNVSSGSDPFYITVESPEGTTATISPSTTSKSYDLTTYFEGENPNGKWYITLQNAGYSYNPNQIYPTSTVTPTLKVTYSY